MRGLERRLAALEQAEDRRLDTGPPASRVFIVWGEAPDQAQAVEIAAAKACGAPVVLVRVVDARKRPDPDEDAMPGSDGRL